MFKEPMMGVAGRADLDGATGTVEDIQIHAATDPPPPPLQFAGIPRERLQKGMQWIYPTNRWKSKTTIYRHHSGVLTVAGSTHHNLWEHDPPRLH